MKARQFQQLASRPKRQYFELLGEGLTAIAANCRSLDKSASALAVQRRGQAAELLWRLAEEEAGKFLILLDAVRLGGRSQALRTDQLERAGLHLAKGLYSKAASICPATFGELIGYLELQRAELYLDGPNDVDWIFRNEVLMGREELLYVDLIEAEGELIWLSPERFSVLESSATPTSVALVLALSAARVHRPDALTIIEQIWRNFVPEPATEYQELLSRIEMTLDLLEHGGLLGSEFGPTEQHLIRAQWPFPLHHADLTSIGVTEEELQQRRDAALRHVMGIGRDPI